MPAKYVSESRLLLYNLPLYVNWPKQPPNSGCVLNLSINIFSFTEVFNLTTTWALQLAPIFIFYFKLLLFLGLSLGRTHPLISKWSTVSRSLSKALLKYQKRTNLELFSNTLAQSELRAQPQFSGLYVPAGVLVLSREHKKMVGKRLSQMTHFRMLSGLQSARVIMLIMIFSVFA